MTEVNCVNSKCDATVEHGVKAKDTFTHDRIYFLILRKLSYAQHLTTELKYPRFDVLAIGNIKITIFWDVSLLPEDGGTGIHVLYCVASHPRGLMSEQIPILFVCVCVRDRERDTHTCTTTTPSHKIWQK
jgi:hypothetical protein